MVTFGIVSSVFDMLSFFVLRVVFETSVEVFRGGWFVISTATELVIMLVLRTRRPFFRSRPGRPLLWSSVLVALITLALPYSALAGVLGMTALPFQLVMVLFALTVLYLVVNELVKRVALIT